MNEEEFHPRAMKLIRKRKNFIVIAEDEPYYFSVYSLIRKNEKEKGTWTEADENIYAEEKKKHICAAGHCRKLAVIAGLCREHSF